MLTTTILASLLVWGEGEEPAPPEVAMEHLAAVHLPAIGWPRLIPIDGLESGPAILALGFGKSTQRARVGLEVLSAGQFEKVRTQTVELPGWSRSSVTGIGDLDGDGVSDFLIGRPWSAGDDFDPGGADGFRGEVIAFSGATLEELYRSLGEPDLRQFGRSITCVGDVTEDGVEDFVASALWTAGWSLLVVDGAKGEVWQRMNRVAPSWDGATIRLHHVDAWPHLGVGTFGTDDTTARMRGRWSGYRLPVPGLSLLSFEDGEVSATSSELWKPGDALVSGSDYGVKISAIGDVTGDGFSDLAVGVSDSYRVELLSGGDLSLISSIDLPEQESALSDDGFGEYVTSLPDLNGDGVGELLVSARQWSDWSQDNGRDGRVRAHVGRVWILSGGDGAALAEVRNKIDYHRPGKGDYHRLGTGLVIVEAAGETRAVIGAGNEVNFYRIVGRSSPTPSAG